jgi:hypothetical protein
LESRIFKMIEEDFVKKQYDDWLATNPIEDDVLEESNLRQMIIDDLTNVSQMTVEEYTLYQKYLEIHERYPSEKRSTIFGEEYLFANEEHRKLIHECKAKIWMPESPEDFDKLDIEMIYTDENNLDTNMSAGSTINKWNCIRTFTSTMKNNSNIGRNMHYIIRDRITEKYLGVICITGDFIDLTPRDNYIGWDREFKTKSGKLNHTCIGSTIVPLQPLGFNYTGGKLLALLCLSDVVQNQWKQNYGNTLVSVTTTSLYGKSKAGGLSQYDNLKHWKKMGYSSGSLTYEMTKSVEREMLRFFKKHDTERYFIHYVAKNKNGLMLKRDHRNRYRSRAFSKLNIPKEIIRSEHHRGIYFSPLYNNTCEYLRGEIDDSKLVKSFDTSVEYLVNLWKTKYASKRIKSLIKNDRTNLNETLFYDDICFMNWEETKERYLTQVGR